MQQIKAKLDLKRTFFMMLILTSMILNTQGIAQEKKDFAFGDSLFKNMSIDDLIKIRKHYDQKADESRLEEEKILERGMKLGESFLGERGVNIKDRDKVYIRVAEYYIIEAYQDFESDQEKYENEYLAYERQLVLFDNNQLDEEPVQPEFPKTDYSKAISVYDRLMTEYPASEYADEALYSKAWLLDRMGDGIQSRRIYQEVIDKYPDSRYAPESYIQLAEYYFAPRDDKTDDSEIIVELQKAIQLYKKVLKYKNSKRYDEALYKLGWSYYKLAARDPKYYNEAITYFIAVADDIERALKMDPRGKISNPNVRDEAIEYVGISFTDEAYTPTGVDKARNLINRIGGREYGPEIMQAIGQTFQKIDEQDKAIYAFDNLLEMYPTYDQNPAIQQKIVDAHYALGRDDQAYQTRTVLYNNYGPESEFYKNLAQSDDPEKLLALKSAYSLSEAALRTNVSLDLEAAQEAETNNLPSTAQYETFASNCKTFLDVFPADSNAYDVNWSYAFVLDSKLGRFEEAFEEYIRVSNDYLEESHQHDAAINAVSIADTLVKIKYGSKGDTVSFNLADVAKLSPEALTPEETRLIEAYDNYIRLFPAGQYSPNFLAAAGGIYYNHKKFAEAKVYFRTLVKRFPGAEQKSLALRSIMDSYFALGKFKLSESVAKRIMTDPGVTQEQREFASMRMAAAIFKNAEYLEEQGDYFAAANEFFRVYQETPQDKQFVEPALFNSGRNFKKAKDWIRAVETFDVLATNYPDSKHAISSLENMADSYREMDQYSNAAATYERIFNQYPQSENSETALYNAGYYYKKGEDWQKAIDANNRYINSYPQKTFSIDLFFSNADLFLKMDNETEANRIYEQFAQKYPDDPRTVTAFYERGKYYMETDRDEMAKAEFDKAIRRSENFRRQGKDPNAYIAGEAVNALASILHDEFISIELKQPQSNMNAQKARMRTTLTELNKTYSKVLTFGSPRSFEATYNIARSYEEFADIYADQEINPAISKDKQFVEKKRINEEAAQLYEKAVEQYKEVVTNIPLIAERLDVDIWAEQQEKPAVSDSLIDSTAIARAAEKDSTQALGRKFYHKAQDKISYLLYTEATLTSDNVHQAVNITPPYSDPLKNMIYKLSVLKKVAAPAIEQTISSHIRNLNDAQTMNLENKYVEESKRQILLTSNIMAQEIEELAFESLTQYKRLSGETEVLVEKEFEAVNNQGLDYYALDNLTNQMIDYTKILSGEVLTNYSNTLELADANNIKNDLIRNTQDRMLRFTLEITDQMEIESALAKEKSEHYQVRFDSTENYNYDDAIGFFDTYYYNLNDNSKEIMDIAYQAKETYDIKNLWANKLVLKLIKIDPLTYSGSVEKDKIVLVSDQSWKATTTYSEGVWPTMDFDDSNWGNAKVEYGYEDQFAGLDVQPDAIWIPLPSMQLTPDTTAMFVPDSVNADSTSMSAAIDTLAAADTSLFAEAGEFEADSIVFFRKTIELNGTPVSGEIFVTADNDFRLYLNGEYLLDDAEDDFNSLDTLDYYTFQEFLKPGRNVIGIDVEDKDHSRKGLKFYGSLEVLPLDITAAAEEKAKVQKVVADPVILRKINILNKNRISNTR